MVSGPPPFHAAWIRTQPIDPEATPASTREQEWTGEALTPSSDAVRQVRYHPVACREESTLDEGGSPGGSGVNRMVMRWARQGPPGRDLDTTMEKDLSAVEFRPDEHHVTMRHYVFGPFIAS
jgi:hypothetical protein